MMAKWMHRMLKRFKLRHVGLILATICLAVMLLLTLTPIAWEAEGMQSEQYPELVYGTFGVPIGFANLIWGLMNAFDPPNTPPDKKPHYLVLAAQWLLCALLLAFASLPWVAN